MRLVQATADGAWFEVETTEDASLSESISRTGIIWRWFAEQRRRDAGGEPQKMYILIGSDGVARAFVRAEAQSTSGMRSEDEGTIAVGFGMTNPYPLHQEDIASLGDAIGLPIGPENVIWKDHACRRDNRLAAPDAPVFIPEGLSSDQEEALIFALRARSSQPHQVSGTTLEAVQNAQDLKAALTSARSGRPVDGKFADLVAVLPCPVVEVCLAGLRYLFDGATEIPMLTETEWDAINEMRYRLEAKSFLRSCDPEATPTP